MASWEVFSVAVRLHLFVTISLLLLLLDMSFYQVIIKEHFYYYHYHYYFFSLFWQVWHQLRQGAQKCDLL